MPSIARGYGVNFCVSFGIPFSGPVEGDPKEVAGYFFLGATL